MGKYRLANKEFGDWGEQIAVDYLINNNIKILGRNILIGTIHCQMSL